MEEEVTQVSAEDIRRKLIAEGVPERMLDQVIASGGQVWTTAQLQEEFTVVGFAAPLVVVTRKSDNQTGTLMFTHSPRFYYGFEADRG